MDIDETDDEKMQNHNIKKEHSPIDQLPLDKSPQAGRPFTPSSTSTLPDQNTIQPVNKSASTIPAIPPSNLLNTTSFVHKQHRALLAAAY